MKIGYVFFIFFVLLSCRKEELAVLPFPRGDVQSNTASIGATYAMQLYFDLESNSFVATNPKIAWDLGFSGAPGDRTIRLNSSKLMAVWPTGITDFFSITDTIGAQWRYDHPSGDADSTAFYGWQDSSVFVIDRGYNSSGTHLGFVKMQCISLVNEDFHFRISAMNGTGLQNYLVQKDSNYNQVCFSITDGMVVPIEPPKQNWDLHFTQYTHIYADGDHYLVTGVLSNPYQTFLAKDTLLNFSAVTINDAMVLWYDATTDRIGFDWKSYDFDSGTYLVFPEYCYFIQTAEGRYFKLHFLDFYNDLGEKGFPEFEFKEL